MRIINKFKGLTGTELLTFVSDQDSIVNVRGEMMSVITLTLPFCNQAEIASIDEATHVSVQTRFMSNTTLVRV